MCLVLRWQKNRYDVFMRMARVCQADGVAIAARRISEEKHEIVVPRFRRDRTCFLSPFFASVSRIFPVLLPSLPRVLPLAIKSDLTSIYLRIYPVGASALLSSFLFFHRPRAFTARGMSRMNFVYIIYLFSPSLFWLIRRQWG